MQPNQLFFLFFWSLALNVYFPYILQIMSQNLVKFDCLVLLYHHTLYDSIIYHPCKQKRGLKSSEVWAFSFPITFGRISHWDFETSNPLWAHMFLFHVQLSAAWGLSPPSTPRNLKKKSVVSSHVANVINTKYLHEDGNSSLFSKTA